MTHRLHHIPSVHSGLIFYPFSEAKVVLEGCAEIAASATLAEQPKVMATTANV
jgi:hypothetical protein